MLGQPAPTGAAYEHAGSPLLLLLPANPSDQPKLIERRKRPSATISVWTLYWLTAGSIQILGATCSQVGHHWQPPQAAAPAAALSQLETEAANQSIRPAPLISVDEAASSALVIMGLVEAAGE